MKQMSGDSIRLGNGQIVEVHDIRQMAVMLDEITREMIDARSAFASKCNELSMCHQQVELLLNQNQQLASMYNRVLSIAQAHDVKLDVTFH